MSVTSLQTSTQLAKLFQEGDLIWTGSLYETRPLKDSEFVCINPLKDLSQSRSDDNISSYRNFLFEFDGVELTMQYRALEKLKSHENFKIATATFSGSKSLHLIVSLADTLEIPYRQAWTALCLELTSITNLIADPSCKNPSRLSRLAGFTREETGLVQDLVYTGSYITNSYIQTLVLKHNIESSGLHSSSKTEVVQNMSYATFKFRLKAVKGLQTKLMNVHEWAGPVNMYPELLKLTMWAIDSTGVPEEVFVEYCKKYLQPTLDAVGYERGKLETAIRNAYIYKV